MSKLDLADATALAAASTVSVAIVSSATAVAAGPSAGVVDDDIATTASVFVILNFPNEIYDDDEVLYLKGNKIKTITTCIIMM